MDFAPVTEFVSRNWFFTSLIGAIGWLTQRIFSLHEKKASFEAQISTLEKCNTDSKKETASLKAENLELQKAIQNKYSNEAVLAKYEFNNIGVAVHKGTKKPHCPACLQNLPTKEVKLLDSGNRDDYLRCPIDHNHIYEKSQGRTGSLHQQFGIEND